MALYRNKGTVKSLEALTDQAIVNSITSLLQTLNPQSFNLSPESSAPLNQFAHHLNPSFVVSVLKNQTNPYHGLFFFNWASNPNPNPNGYSHTHHCYIAITDLLLKHSLLSTASALLLRTNKLRDFMIGKLVKAHGDRGEIRAAIDWFHRAKVIEKGRCLFSYNALLGVLVRANRVGLAEALFDQILDEGLVDPDVYTYSTMIKGFCKMGMVDKARKVFDEMRCDPNPVTCNAMISGFCGKGDMESARRVLGFMVDSKNCLPDTITYTALIDGYCKKGDVDKAMEYLKEMEVRGCDLNVLTYNALVHGFCLIGEVEEAKRMVTKMRLNGVKDDLVTHTAILKGLCIVGKFDQAVRHLSDMIALGIKPDVKAYGVLVNECCKMKKPVEAISLLREMRAMHVNPHVSIVNLVLKSLCGNGDVDRAVNLLKHMPEMGCSPNFSSYNQVILNLCRRKGWVREVEELVCLMIREGHKPDRTLYSCLVEKYCDDENLEKAKEIFYEALSNSYVISLDSFAVLTKKLFATGRVQDSKAMLQDMTRCNTVDVNSYRGVLYHCGNSVR